MPNTEVQCPNCGSFATLPRDRSWLEGGKMFQDEIFGRRVTFENSKWVQAFRSGQIGAVCSTCRYEFDVNTPFRRRSSGPGDASAATRSVAERMKALEELRAAGLITADEYNQKRTDILRGL